MIALQILNKVVQTGDIQIIKMNDLDVDYFPGYEEEYEYIVRHFDKYGNVPQQSTFLNKFRNFELETITESDDYLLDAVSEEKLYADMVEMLQDSADILTMDSRDALEFVRGKLTGLNSDRSFKAVDIIQDAEERYVEYLDKKKQPDGWAIPTGFKELDKIISGFQRGEEYVVIFARTGQGKSWVLAKMMVNAWMRGNRVGYISPEMSASKIGYRFDTLYKNFSNRALVRGYDQETYKPYIEELQKKDTPFLVATPHDFQKKITISKLRSFVKANKLDILAVDGITYMTDERYQRGDSKTTMLTNISEDLLSLSNELKIPVVVVVQSNRGGVKDKTTEGTPDIENIRDSDGISHNATKIISLRHKRGEGLEMGIKKHRDGEDGGKLLYQWEIDRGEFLYIPSEDEIIDDEVEYTDDITDDVGSEEKPKPKKDSSYRKGSVKF